MSTCSARLFQTANGRKSGVMPRTSPLFSEVSGRIGFVFSKSAAAPDLEIAPSHIIWENSMRTSNVRAALACFLMLLANVACNRSTQLRIAVVPKGQTHIFWQSVHAGAVMAGNEMGAQILWNGPATELDLSK